jgi:hypothetical protein
VKDAGNGNFATAEEAALSIATTLTENSAPTKKVLGFFRLCSG